MRRLWVGAVVLLLAACGTAAATPQAGATGQVEVASSAAPARTTGAPGAHDWAAMSRAVHASPLTSAVPDSEYAVVGLELAGSSGQWAGGMIEPRTQGSLQPVAVLLHHVHGGWKLVDLGTAMVGCGAAPRPVLDQLRFFDVPPHC